MTIAAAPRAAAAKRGRVPAQRREHQPTIPDLVVAHFLRGEDLAAELAARLACDSDYSLAQLYETLRIGIYESADPHAAALPQCVLDERLVQLAARLEPAPHRRREPEAIVFSTGRRGMAAAISHMLRAAGIPAIRLDLSDLTTNRRGASAISRDFIRVQHIVVDAGAARREELLYFSAMLAHLRLLHESFNVVVLGDDEEATETSALHEMSGLKFVRDLSLVMDAVGVPAASPLTARERAVLEFTSEGATNQQTAKALGISIATVKTYLARAQFKLNACDRASAVATALRRGWI